MWGVHPGLDWECWWEWMGKKFLKLRTMPHIRKHLRFYRNQFVVGLVWGLPCVPLGERVNSGPPFMMTTNFGPLLSMS